MHLDVLADDLEAVVEKIEQHGAAKLARPNERCRTRRRLFRRR
jgi:hypothetical protein